MKVKVLAVTVALALVLSLTFALAGPVSASPPSWNVTGTWNVDVVYQSVTYHETLVLTQTGGTITGVNVDLIPPNSSSLFNITNGTVSGNSINFTAQESVGSITEEWSGTIANDGLSMHGTWSDTSGGNRSGTWQTTSGQAASTATFYGTDTNATIDVTAPTVPKFAPFVFGDNVTISSSDGAVVVTLNSQSPSAWTVTAKDANTDGWSGYMTSGPTPPSETGKLTNQLIISPNNFTNIYWANTGFSYSGNVFPVPASPLPFYAKQNIVNGDAAGLYTITIVFAGSLGF